MADTPDHHRFQSTALMSGDYDRASQTLSVTFRNGRTFELTGVPPDEWEAFCASPSPGAFFNSVLKGRY